MVNKLLTLLKRKSGRLRDKDIHNIGTELEMVLWWATGEFWRVKADIQGDRFKFVCLTESVRAETPVYIRRQVPETVRSDLLYFVISRFVRWV